MNFIFDWLSDLDYLFFPTLCVACENNAHIKGQLFCTNCSYHISPTDHFIKPDNDFTKKFVGRIKIMQGGALYRFIPGGHLQKVIHKLKYKNRPDIAMDLGKFAASLIKSNWQIPDIIIPVPMHSSKIWNRGYNQADKIAEGIAQILNKPNGSHALIKLEKTTSQTTKHRMERMKNVFSSIVINPKFNLIANHVLLVDDVLTTGATLESCCQALISAKPEISISLFTLASGETLN